jgi:O-antigen/teichoic acid export membrane protein
LAVAEAGPATAVFVACFLLNIPLGIVNRIQIGYQQGFANNLWTALGSMFALGAVVLACKLRASLPWLVFAMTGTPMLAIVINGAFLFGTQRPWLLPTWKYSNRVAAATLFRVGMMFFVLQIAAAVGFSTDGIVIAQILGASAVTQYSVPARMFGVITMLIVTILSPLWPAYGEALARKEFPWMRKTLKRSIFLGVAIAVPSYAILLLFGRRLLHLWVGNEVQPTFLLLGGFAMWGIVNAIGNPLTYFLNGANIIRLQVISATLMALINITISIILTHRIGIAGPVWGSIISYSLISLLPFAIYIPRLLRSWVTPAGLHANST